MNDLMAQLEQQWKACPRMARVMSRRLNRNRQTPLSRPVRMGAPYRTPTGSDLCKSMEGRVLIGTCGFSTAVLTALRGSSR
jgi:hypothetical protein